MVSELATNAVRYTDGSFNVCIEQYQDTVRVEVSDGTSAMPVLQTPGPAEIGGRGLLIVQRLSDDWGVADSGPGGKTVWFTIHDASRVSR